MPDPSTVDRPWLASYPPGVPASYTWPQVALPRLLADAARDFPELDGVRVGASAWTWATLNDLATLVATGLQQLGVRPGHRVALALPNGPAAVAVAFGTWRAGGVLVLLDGALPRSARDDVLAATTPRVTVATSDDWPDTAGVCVVVAPSDLAPARGRLGRLRARFRRDTGPTPSPDRAIAWSELVAGDAPPVLPDTSPDAPAVLAPTGGTTGHRHIVTLTHANLVANAFQARLWVPDVQAGHERVLAATPFTHPFGLTVGLLASTLAAATLVVPDGVDGDALGRLSLIHI